MLRIEEIVGAMDDEFRYALDALSDERLAALAADKAALRRLRPVGVSHAEAQAMIAAIQARRQEEGARREQAEHKKRECAAKRAAAPKVPRKRKTAPPPAQPDTPAATARPACLPSPPAPPRLPAPIAAGPAIRLPPPPKDGPTIPLPPPEQTPAPSVISRRPPKHLPTMIIAAGLLAVAALLWMM